MIPVHLNELSPDDVRGTFPGFSYQLGNLIASVNATLQASIAAAMPVASATGQSHGDYAYALAITAAVVAVAVAILAFFGPEARGVRFGGMVEENREALAVQSG